MATRSTNEEADTTPSTATEKFFRYFQHEVTDLQEQMTRIENHGAIGGERADAIDHCLFAISRLSGEVQDASSYIPAHDKRTYSEAIRALQSKLQDVRAAGLSRQKFSFKKSSALFTAQKNESAISLNDAAELAKEKRRQLSDPLLDKSDTSSYVNTPADPRTPANEHADIGTYTGAAGIDLVPPRSENVDALEAGRTVRQPSFSASTSVSINNHERAHIILPTAASCATSSGTVSNVKRCVVDMSSPTTHGQPFATLTLKNISSSLIICGHVNGAAHLTKIQDSVILVASRQFRMHESVNCDVYLLATSRPIIEDCTAIRFAPLPQAYMTEADHERTNQWANVDDFKWLRNEPNPNWKPLDTQNRISDTVWKDIVPGGHDLSVDDILNSVGVPK